MKKFTFCLALFATIVLLQSCATIFSGTRSTVMLQSNVAKAEKLTIDGYSYHDVTFPFYLKVKHGYQPTRISVEEGDEKVDIEVRKIFNPVSLLNLFIGTFPCVVDAATGALTKPEYKTYEVFFNAENPSPLKPKSDTEE